MKQSVAMQRLKGMVAWETTPSLDDADIRSLLEQAKRADSDHNPIEDVVEWEASKLYSSGSLVSGGDGYAYRSNSQGVSGAAKPTWSASTVDGTITWVREGKSSWTPTYDLNYAASEGWALKAAKATSMISFSADDASYDREQFLANCLTMQQLYSSRITASVTVASPRRRRARR